LCHNSENEPPTNCCRVTREDDFEWKSSFFASFVSGFLE
jgi:hypothetical protein